MSRYVKRMKDVLVSFNATAQRIHRDMDRNNTNYKPDVAADENTRLQVELNKAAGDARAQIDSIYEDAAAAVMKWAEPAGGEINTADLTLLNGSFDLSVEALHDLLVKHQDNGTMVNAIAKYAKKSGVVLDYIPNASDKLAAYEAFAGSAHSMIGSIVGTIGLSDNSFALSKWAEPGNISQRMELALYGIKKKESGTENPPKGNFNFGFRPLDGRGN